MASIYECFRPFNLISRSLWRDICGSVRRGTSISCSVTVYSDENRATNISVLRNIERYLNPVGNCVTMKLLATRRLYVIQRERKGCVSERRNKKEQRFLHIYIHVASQKAVLLVLSPTTTLETERRLRVLLEESFSIIFYLLRLS